MAEKQSSRRDVVGKNGKQPVTGSVDKKLVLMRQLLQRQRAILISTPESKARPDESEEGKGDVFRVLALKKLARAVKKVQEDRQRRLEATGNESLWVKVQKFKPKQIEEHLTDILSETLSDVTYDPIISGEMSRTICDVIRDTLKTLKYPRYRFVTTLTLGEKGPLSIIQGTGFLWNTETDSFASVVYQNETLVATATVFAVFAD